MNIFILNIPQPKVCRDNVSFLEWMGRIFLYLFIASACIIVAMKLLILLSFLLFVSAQTVDAQDAPFALADQGKDGEVLETPLCGKLINRSDQTIMGFLATMSQRIESGDMVKHRDNFTLQSGQEREFCAAGPFYEGRRLELVLRTIIPLFSCKTQIDQDIYLDAVADPSGFKKLSATCR